MSAKKRHTSLLAIATIVMLVFIPNIAGGDVPAQCNDGDLLAIASPSYFTSPHYPYNYPNNVHCMWHISSSQSSSSSSTIVLNLLSFNLDGALPNCGYDKVIIYDGPSTDSPTIHKLCGRVTSLQVTSTGPYMTVVYQSNGMSSNTGFEFEYKSKEGVASVVGDTLMAYSTVKYLTSPNYPDPYPSDIDWQWHITSDTYSSKVVLKIKMVDLEGNRPDCTSDYVKIYDGDSTVSPLMYVLCGDMNYGRLVSTSRNMTVVFHSDGENSYYRGFRFTYQSQGSQTTDTTNSGYSNRHVRYVMLRVGLSVGMMLVSMAIVICVWRLRKQRLEKCAQNLAVRQNVMDNSVWTVGIDANNRGAPPPYAEIEDYQRTSNPPGYPGQNYDVNRDLPSYTSGSPDNDPRSENKRERQSGREC